MSSFCVQLPTWEEDFPDAAAKLDEIRKALDDARGRVSGAVQGKLDDARLALDELRGRLPVPEHPIHVPDAGAWLDDLRAKFDEVRSQAPDAVDELKRRVEEYRASLQPGQPGQPAHPIELPDFRGGLDALKARLDDLRNEVNAAAKSKVDEIRAKLDEYRASLAPVHPIEIPEFGNRLDHVKARLEEIRAEAPGASQGVVDEVTAKLDALRERACGGQTLAYMPSFFEQVQGTLDVIRQNLPEPAANAIDQAKAKAAELQSQFASGVEEIKQRLAEAEPRTPIRPKRRMMQSLRDKLSEHTGHGHSQAARH